MPRGIATTDISLSSLGALPVSAKYAPQTFSPEPPPGSEEKSSTKQGFEDFENLVEKLHFRLRDVELRLEEMEMRKKKQRRKTGKRKEGAGSKDKRVGNKAEVKLFQQCSDEAISP